MEPIKYPTKKDSKVPYAGEGYRLDGKVKKPDSQSTSQTSTDKKSKDDNENMTLERGIPNYDYVIGTLNFNRNLTKKEEVIIKKLFFFMLN